MLQAERKVEILETLVKVSAEITSTLDLDRVLDAIVTGPGAVIPYERAAIALEERGRLKIRAITGMPRINPQDPNVVRLQEILEWASLSNEPVSFSQHGERIRRSPARRRKPSSANISRNPACAAFMLCPWPTTMAASAHCRFESSDPDFLGPAHLEMIKILSAQATVALRNASLYREVPFIDLLKPVLDRKRKFLALEKRRRAVLVAGGAAALLFLLIFPLPLRVVGDATVSPAQSVLIQPEVEGTVQRVQVREGDAVSAGTTLATLSDWQYRAQLAAAQAKYETAVSQMNRALNSNDGGEAGIQRIQADYWASELARARERLDRTQLRSPINGVVATPHVEDMVGRKLMPGDTFAEVVDTSRAIVDVAIDADDVLLLHPGEKASIKLEGFPTRTFHGVVAVVSPRSQVQGTDRFFFARVLVPNPDGAIRDGMQGRGQSCDRMESGRKSNLPPSRDLDLVETVVVVRMVAFRRPPAVGRASCPVDREASMKQILKLVLTDSINDAQYAGPDRLQRLRATHPSCRGSASSAHNRRDSSPRSGGRRVSSPRARSWSRTRWT